MAEPRPSASVILVRDGPDGLETFMVRRHARSAVAPDAYVFPGGTVRADDHQAPVVGLAYELFARSDTPVSAADAIAFYVCAIRELFEEAGVLLVTDGHGQILRVAEDDVTFQEMLETTRRALQAGQLTLTGVLVNKGWRPAFELLVPFSHWITRGALRHAFLRRRNAARPVCPARRHRDE